MQKASTSLKQRPSSFARSPLFLSSESGAVIVILAAAVMVIVLLGVSYTIDLPTTHVAKVRAQTALDIGAENGIKSGLVGYAPIASAARSNAISAQQSTTGHFSTNFQDDSSFRVVVPRLGRANYYSPFGVLSLRHQNIMSKTLDPPGIDDFGNTVLLYSQVTPDQHFRMPLLNDSPSVEVVSAARMVNVLNYVLIDPAFSMDTNYNHIFGQTEHSTQNMWPVYADVAKYGDVRTSWTYPSDAGMLMQNPSGRGTPPPTGGSGNVLEGIYKFYSAACDSAPWSYYKWTAVDLLDRFSRSSAFNSTTYVGLTGYNGTYPIIPIHPLVYDQSTGVAIHPYNELAPDNSTQFPLQVNSTQADNRGLHHRKPAAFHGFFNTDSPDIETNMGPNGEYDHGTIDDLGSGLNRWELCYCAGLYREGTEYALLPDSAAAAVDDIALSHAPRTKRTRSATSHTHWCDDTPVYQTQGLAPDTIVNLQDRQSGAGGETPRNLIAGLAMRTQDLQLDTIMNPTNSTNWERPTLTNDFFNPHEPMDTGTRYLPDAITAASKLLAQARTDYSANSTFGTKRPIGLTSLIIFAFSPWSESTYLRLLLEEGFTDALLQERFSHAIGDAICSKGVNITFAFLPMNYFDLFTISQAQEVIKDYEEYLGSGEIASGSLVSTQSCSPFTAGGGDAHGSVLYFVTNYRDFEPSGNEHLQKLKAAAFFRTSMPDNIIKSLISYVFPM